MPAGFAATSVAALIECPLKVRVKLNSPSLCPTMFSVTYTGMNFLPLCTAIVCPTISGITVDRRDHVRRTFFSLREFRPSTLVRRYPSTNAPFLVERAISPRRDVPCNVSLLPNLRDVTTYVSELLLAAPAHDELIGPLVVPRLIATSRLAPRGYRMPSARSLSFTTTVRMIHRVHRNAPVMRTLAQPPRPSRLADRDVLVIDVADLPDRRHAILRDLARLARGQLY